MVGSYKIYQPWHVGCITQCPHIIHHLVTLVLDTMYQLSQTGPYFITAEDKTDRSYLFKCINSLDSHKGIPFQVECLHDLQQT